MAERPVEMTVDVAGPQCRVGDDGGRPSAPGDAALWWRCSGVFSGVPCGGEGGAMSGGGPVEGRWQVGRCDLSRDVTRDVIGYVAGGATQKGWEPMSHPVSALNSGVRSKAVVCIARWQILKRCQTFVNLCTRSHRAFTVG